MGGPAAHRPRGGGTTAVRDCPRARPSHDCHGPQATLRRGRGALRPEGWRSGRGLAADAVRPGGPARRGAVAALTASVPGHAVAAVVVRAVRIGGALPPGGHRAQPAPGPSSSPPPPPARPLSASPGGAGLNLQTVIPCRPQRRVGARRSPSLRLANAARQYLADLSPFNRSTGFDRPGGLVFLFVHPLPYITAMPRADGSPWSHSAQKGTTSRRECRCSHGLPHRVGCPGAHATRK